MPRRSLNLGVFGAVALIALATGRSDAAPGPGSIAVAPRGYHPMPSSAPAVPCKAPPTLRYYGGPVLQNVKVYSVNWGSNISATVTGQMPLFYTDVVASPYLDWLSEYDTVGLNGLDNKPGSNQGISRGTFAGSVTIAPSLCAGAGSPGSCAVTDAQLQAELVAQIGAGHLPLPTTGCDGQLDTVYMVNFHSSVTIVGAAGRSCVDYCAYHGKGSYQGQAFAYAVLPDFSAGGCSGAGCGPNSLLQNTTAVASHELVESITDPLSPSPGRPLAWFDQTCGEIADICVLLYGTINTSGTTWTVTQLWSNALQECITTKASLPPFCTATNTPPGCRPCTCADGDTCAVSAGDGGAAPDAGADVGAADSGAASDASADADATMTLDASPSADGATGEEAASGDVASPSPDATSSLDGSPGGDASSGSDAPTPGDDGGGGRAGEGGGCGCALADTRSRGDAIACAIIVVVLARRRARHAHGERGALLRAARDIRRQLDGDLRRRAASERGHRERDGRQRRGPEAKSGGRGAPRGRG